MVGRLVGERRRCRPARSRARRRGRRPRSRRRSWCPGRCRAWGSPCPRSRRAARARRRRPTCSGSSPRAWSRAPPCSLASPARCACRGGRSAATKSSSGSPAAVTSRMLEPCWRAVTRVVSRSTASPTCGVRRVADVDADHSGGDRAARRSSRSRAAATGCRRCRAPPPCRRTSRISPSSKPSRSICESSSVSLPVTSYVVSVASWIRTSRSPSVFTTSGSSTPCSWTLVPVSLFDRGGGLRGLGRLDGACREAFA